MLAVVETHPVQYHAPVYRELERLGVPVTAIYGSDFSVRRYRDSEFGAEVAWGTDLLTGYAHRFLSRATEEREPDLRHVSARGLDQVLRGVSPRATMIVGYSPAFHRHAWSAAWRLGRPVLFRGEASDVGRPRRPVVDAARDVALRFAYRHCARALYIGERAREHYRRLGVPDARLVFSPYCVDTMSFRADETSREEARLRTRGALGLEANALVIAFCGKLSPRKGADLLVEALPLLARTQRGACTLLYVGDGVLRADLDGRAATLGITAQFVGVQPQHRLSDYYHAADLLVLPSRSGETWGLVVNEALHHGLPCVVSDHVGCAPDLIDASTGTVCQAGSVEALAGALAQAVALTGRADVRATCRARADRYSVEHAARGIADAYHAVTVRQAAA